MQGTLPEALGLWENITNFIVYRNAISGTVPMSLSGWKEIEQFQTFNNHLAGGALPALPFERMSYCNLFSNAAPSPNSYDCPWPDEVVPNCQYYDSRGKVASVAPTDCTGYSCNTATGQCEVDPMSTQPPSDCIATCKEPTNYQCDTSTGQCMLNATGGTQSAQDCITGCECVPVHNCGQWNATGVLSCNTNVTAVNVCPACNLDWISPGPSEQRVCDSCFASPAPGGCGGK
jgi:hypothetical protein